MHMERASACVPTCATLALLNLASIAVGHLPIIPSLFYQLNLEMQKMVISRLFALVICVKVTTGESICCGSLCRPY
uniref:Secreted protein n=1 Tax=Romanomermis culicivorax TaxID=13658 RepID=A0A915JFL7_ROMCU